MEFKRVFQDIELWNSAGVDQVFYQHAHHLAKLLPENARQSFCTLLLLLYAKRSSGQICLEWHSDLLIKELQSYYLSYVQSQEKEKQAQELKDDLETLALSYAQKQINPIFQAWNQDLFQDMIGEINKPLVLHENKIYLQRDFRNQQIVEESIKKLASHTIKQDWQRLSQVWHDVLEQHPVRNRSKETIPFSNKQKQAIAQALLMPVSIISGGPGTGKTSVAVNLLRLLKHLKQLGKFALVAPTGKAGQRLFESVQQGLNSIAHPTSDDQNLRSQLQSASTLHRLLGYSVKNGHFSRNQFNPLRLNTLIIDEVSMIDLEMMAKLLGACQQGTRLILLGDADQLPPVGAGRPLMHLLEYAGCLNQKDIVQFHQIDPNMFQDMKLGQSSQIQGLGQQKLTESYRQQGESAFIYKLACRWNQKTSDEKKLFEGIHHIQQLDEHPWQRVSLYECDLNHEELLKFTKFWSQNFPKLHETQESDTWFEQQFESQVLTLHRQGTWGVLELNKQLANLYLKRKSLAGARIMITKNDYVHGLYNGDQGLCVQKEGELHFAFAGEASHRLIKEQELSGWELAYAITVHKSQGSEYEHIAIILPDQISPIFTRSALYTALTRAKKSVLLVGSQRCIPEVLKKSDHQML